MRTSAKSSLPKTNSSEIEIPPIFNSTILSTDFYLMSAVKGESGQDLPRINFTEFEGMYRSVWNMAIEILMDCHSLDRFGRLIQSFDKAEQRFRQSRDDSNQDKTFEELLTDTAIDSLVYRKNSQEWIKLFPKCCAQIPIYRMIALMRSGASRIFYQKKSNRNFEIDIPFAMLRKELRSVSVFHNVERGHTQIEYRLANQFDNVVTMVVVSNTEKLDYVIDTIAADKPVQDYIISIGRSSKLEKFNKLLISIKQCEEVKHNDSVCPGEELPQEDSKMGHP